MAALQLDGVNINTLVASDSTAEAEIVAVSFFASKNLVPSISSTQSTFHDRSAGSGGGAQETSKESWE